MVREEINHLRLDENRKLKFCQKLSDHSVRELRESVSNEKLITMALDDDCTIIF